MFSRRGQQGEEDDGRHDDIKRLEAEIEELRQAVREANDRSLACQKILEGYYKRCRESVTCSHWITPEDEHKKSEEGAK